MKVLFSFMLIICFLTSSFSPAAIAQPVSGPSISGYAAVLIDASTGNIIFEKNADVKMEPASTTKIMTAIIALERGNLSDIVVTGVNPTLAEGTRIYLEEGEKLTLEQMLYALLLNSANDAAIAIAEHIAGDVQSFVDMMNEKAREIGAYNTIFLNPSGLTEDGHLTTANDLAIITRYALKNLPEFRKMVATKNLTIPWQGNDWDRQLINLNKLLWNYDGADGVKTGYTSSAGQTLVATATKDGWQLIAVVLKSQSRSSLWKDAQNLLDYGFNNFQKYDIISENTFIASRKVKYGKEVKLTTAKGFSTVLPKGDSPIIQKVILDNSFTAPISRGQIMGKLDFYQGSRKLGSVDLIAQNNVKRKIYTHWWFWFVLFTLLIYGPFRVLVGMRRYRQHRKQVRYISYLHKYK